MRKYSFFFLLVFSVYVVMPAKAQEAESKFPPNAIFVASYMGNKDLVQEILAASPDKNFRDSFGDTALHVAVFQKNIDIIKLLLDYGYDPNARTTENGYTPLHNAVTANNVEAARLLLKYGANKSIKGFDGLTALDKAKKEDKRDLVMLLYR